MLKNLEKIKRLLVEIKLYKIEQFVPQEAVRYCWPTWLGDNHLHTLVETIATLLAFMVGVMALVRYYSKKDNTFLLIGTGFLGTAFLDGYHAVVTSHYFAQYLPSDLSSLIPWRAQNKRALFA